MPNIFGDSTLDEIIRQRQAQYSSNINSLIQTNMNRASTGAEKAGVGVGSFLGALGAKYFGTPFEETAEGKAIAAKEAALQSVAGKDYSTQKSNQATPQGGMTTQTKQLSPSQAKAQEAKAYLEYSVKYGDTKARDWSMQLNQQALNLAKDERQQAKEAQEKATLDSGNASMASILRGRGASEDLVNAVVTGVLTENTALELLEPDEKDKLDTVGMGRFTLPDGSTAIGGYVTDKNGNVVVKYRDDNGNFVEAPAGTLPEKREGNSITLSNQDVFKNMLALEEKWSKSIKPIKERTANVKSLETALLTGEAKAIQASLAKTFGAKTQSSKELEVWSGVGGLEDRVVNAINRAINGEYGADDLGIINNLLADAQERAIGEWKSVNEQYKAKGKLGQIPSELIGEKVPYVDFGSMPVEELASQDITELTAAQRIRLRRAIEMVGK